MSTPRRAREVAIEWHRDQKYGTDPYVRHLDEVADLVRDHGSKAEIVAYLHDILEDTEIGAARVEEIFGEDVRVLVEIVTDPPGKNRRERKSGSYAKLASVNANGPNALALVVKAADRLANVRACVSGRNWPLLKMYRDERVQFDMAVHRAGLNDAMLDEIGHLLDDRSPQDPPRGSR